MLLHGGMGTKARATTAARLAPPRSRRRPADGDRPLLVVATGSYRGEGFDCPLLDTLFLPAPIAFKGWLVHYVGRVLRPHQSKDTADARFMVSSLGVELALAWHQTWCHSGAVELKRYVAEVARQLTIAAATGDGPVQQVAERLIEALEAALRLALLDALGAAASEISRELAPGSVEVRLRGGEPEFVVTTPPAEPAGEAEQFGAVGTSPELVGVGEGTARINLRLPEALKSRVEQAASLDGLSINTWLVRAAAAAVDRSQSGPARQSPAPHRSQRYTGWAR